MTTQQDWRVWSEPPSIHKFLVDYIPHCSRALGMLRHIWATMRLIRVLNLRRSYVVEKREDNGRPLLLPIFLYLMCDQQDFSEAWCILCVIGGEYGNQDVAHFNFLLYACRDVLSPMEMVGVKEYSKTFPFEGAVEMVDKSFPYIGSSGGSVICHIFCISSWSSNAGDGWPPLQLQLKLQRWECMGRSTGSTQWTWCVAWWFIVY